MSSSATTSRPKLFSKRQILADIDPGGAHPVWIQLRHTTRVSNLYFVPVGETADAEE